MFDGIDVLMAQGWEGAQNFVSEGLQWGMAQGDTAKPLDKAVGTVAPISDALKHPDQLVSKIRRDKTDSNLLAERAYELANEEKGKSTIRELTERFIYKGDAAKAEERMNERVKAGDIEAGREKALFNQTIRTTQKLAHPYLRQKLEAKDVEGKALVRSVAAPVANVAASAMGAPVAGAGLSYALKAGAVAANSSAAKKHHDIANVASLRASMSKTPTEKTFHGMQEQAAHSRRDQRDLKAGAGAAGMLGPNPLSSAATIGSIVKEQHAKQFERAQAHTARDHVQQVVQPAAANKIQAAHRRAAEKASLRRKAAQEKGHLDFDFGEII